MRPWFKSTWEKATHAKQKYLVALATKKSKGTITCLYTWWQDGRHNMFPLKISLVSAYNSNSKRVKFAVKVCGGIMI